MLIYLESIMSKGIKIHGGVNNVGLDSQMRNLNLERITEDPIVSNPGRIWFDDQRARVTYNETPNAVSPSIQSVANLDDLSGKLDDTNTSDFLPNSKQNNSSNDFFFGQPVYGIGESGIDLASSLLEHKKTVIGFVLSDIITSNGGYGNIINAGKLNGSNAQWELVTGAVGGLVPNKAYFLGATPGTISLTPEIVDGGFICMLGIATTKNTLLIRIEPSIKL